MAASARRGWLWSVIALTVTGFAVSIWLAPSAGAVPDRALIWLLFLGSSVHVAATGWLFTFADVRSYARLRRTRYVAVPLGLVAVGAAIAGTLSDRQLDVALLGYFSWQLFHYQKQNLGLVALAASSLDLTALSVAERRLITLGGSLGIAGLVLRPSALQLPLAPHLAWYSTALFDVAAAGAAGCALGGVITLTRRSAANRPPAFCAVYLLAVCFALPLFWFSSPYAAVGGMTIAHGLQYLVLIAMLAAGPRDRRTSSMRLSGFVVVVLAAGTALNLASHLHTGGRLAHLGYGAYLGVVMAHFVVDAGIWRLRDPFPRQFLISRAPYLMRPISRPATDASRAGVLSPHGG